MIMVNNEDIDKITEVFYLLLKGRKPAPIHLSDDYPDNEIKQAVDYINQFLEIYNKASGLPETLSKGDLDIDVPKGFLSFLQSSSKNIEPLPCHIDKRLPKGSRVLVAEDDSTNRQVAKELLERMHLIVVCVNNGQEALHAINRDPFDAVLMDINMPIMDGYEATREIRLIERFKNLPIIAMTANNTVGDREKCIESGMNDHIPKPIDPIVLFNTLTQWIKPRNNECTVEDNSSTIHDLMNKYKASDDKTLPVLPGINVKKAMLMLLNNLEIYKELLGDFISKHYNTIDKINCALKNGLSKEAKILAHTLKGLAATIGASELSFMAKELETTIMEGRRDELSDLLKKTDQEMLSVVTVIREYLKEVSSPVKETETIEIEKIHSFIDELAVLLADNDTKSKKYLKDFKDQFNHPAINNQLDVLEKLTGQFDFDGALEELNRIKNSLGESSV